MDYTLSPSHTQEVKKFVDYFELKRKETLSEIQAAFTQVLKSSSKDEILSWSEVETFINDLKSEVQHTVDSELQNVVYMSGVYIKILMCQAESSNIQLQGDLSFIENEKAIEEMKNLGKVPDQPKKLSGRLPTLTANFASDQQLASKQKELTEERDLLRRKVNEQQVKIIELQDQLSEYKRNWEGN
jgi:hypothetical protein